jgi:hypothetical protein
LLAFHENIGYLKDSVQVVPVGGAALLEKMMMAAAWEAANTRKGYKEDALINHTDFEAHKAYLVAESIGASENKALIAAHRQRDPGKDVLVLEPDAVELLSSLIVSCAWFPANTRKGYDKDASRDMAELTRTFTCLFVHRRPKWLGVNLGGWLLLERGPSHPLFEETEAKHTDDKGSNSLKLPDEEFSVSAVLRKKGLVGEVYRKHREEHFKEEDIVAIKAFGLNAVRVPFG